MELDSTGNFVMKGISEDAPECIHTVEEAMECIRTMGFLPLFQNTVAGFSLEERVMAKNWWTGDASRDPWEWRKIIASSGDILYGKWFHKKAGFISKEWFPTFANFRRDGYDFDARWEDGKATLRQKKIMDLFLSDDTELYSFEIRDKAGFSKEGGEKNYEGTMISLQMQTYLCIMDFRQRKSKSGKGYGMDVAVCTKPEHLFSYDYVTSAYRESPEVSYQRILANMRKQGFAAAEEQMEHILGAE